MITLYSIAFNLSFLSKLTKKKDRNKLAKQRNHHLNMNMNEI